VLNSLKFQITAALLLLLALFAGATGYTFLALEHQRTNDTVVTQAGRLQLTAQYLSNQAMRYKEHAPRNYESYYRDVELYYKDLLGHVETFDMISDAFMHQDFKPMVTGLVSSLRPKLGGDVMAAISTLEEAWQRYRAGLFEALGPDAKEPRLEWAAEYIVEENKTLESSARHLSSTLASWSSRDLARVARINKGVVIAGSLLALGVLAWLFFKVLAPLNRTLRGFGQVAQGDFGVQVQELGSREMTELTRAFNRLSSRLRVLFDLIGRLQAGSDLDQTLGFLSREFQQLLRIDWVGVLFLTADRRSMRLEAGYLDGQREMAGKHLYRLDGTLLGQARDQGRPLHIPDMARTAEQNPGFEFLGTLAAKGMNNAIFLPLTEASQCPIPGVLVFAARARESYDAEHLRLLNNIAQLVTHSFGRTLRLAEHTRLAAIGEFASSIAHEIRSPLATVGLALEHFRSLDLPASSAKRAQLAAREAERIARLLEDMLLYARPLTMRVERLSAAALLREALPLLQGIAEEHGQQINLEADPGDDLVSGDRDRLAQIWINLTRNACDAAPPGATVTWRVLHRPGRGGVEAQVHNTGDPIPPELLPRLTEPFFTTKGSGTGLGLAIVRRMVDAHGGELQILSDAQAGTRVSVILPLLEK
jgi:hypothetical protein